jgi:S-adenosylmethionine:tRNA ribosyltransferase-isomerase
VLTRDFDFELPADRIAQHPVEPRDQSRLMVVRRGSRSIEHRTFADLPELLRAGDVLVRNNTRVVPARLVGRRLATGGRWEGLYLRTAPDLAWEILARTRGRPKLGEFVVLDGGLRLELVGRGDGGTWLARPEPAGDVLALLERFGKVPLPPYIRKGQEQAGDRAHYQTTFAAVPGSVAAPTAGLHFTSRLFEQLGRRGVGVVDLTLHVGLGTFRPIEAERIEDHVLHAEWAELSASAAERLNAARGRGGRIVAVGTTAARTLETAARPDRSLAAWSGPTRLYIRPGHAFRGLDALITNFHLPRSSLLVLVSALAGLELVREAYRQAIAAGYRFYSYGDAMLVLA